MPVCPVCYRENEPVAGRCPGCGSARADPGGLRELDDEPSFPRSRSTAPGASRPRASAAVFGTGERSPPRAQPVASTPRLILKGMAGDVTEYPLGVSNVLGRSTTA